MVVDHNHRRRGFALTVLQALETWCTALGYCRTLVETGKGQPKPLGYVDECHFCYLTRKAILSRFPDYLTPKLVYGADG